MGLFDKFKKNETSVWDNAYKANPQFYAKDDGSPFGAFALTEGTETILPKKPNYAVDGNVISDYRLMLVSTTKDAVIGDIDYFVALSKLDNYKLDENDDSILLRGLSLEELEGLAKTQEKRTLAKDIPEYAEWAKNNLNQTGYKVDYDLESMKEVERFFEEQSKEGGVLVPGSSGSVLFGLGCLIGETIIKTCGGHWETDDNDPQGEVNIAVRLPDNSLVWPVQRCMKRLKNGPEDNIYDYVYVMTKQ